MSEEKHQCAHHGHQQVFKDGDCAHRELKDRSEAGALNGPFCEHALQHPHQAQRHQHEGYAVDKSGFEAGEVGNSQSQLEESINIAPGPEAFRQDVILSKGGDKTPQVEQLKKRKTEEKARHEMLHPQADIEVLPKLGQETDPDDIRENKEKRAVNAPVLAQLFGRFGMLLGDSVLAHGPAQGLLQLGNRYVLFHSDSRRGLFPGNVHGKHAPQADQAAFDNRFTIAAGHPADVVCMCHVAVRLLHKVLLKKRNVVYEITGLSCGFTGE